MFGRLFNDLTRRWRHDRVSVKADDARALFAEGAASGDAGRIDEAAALYRRALSLDPGMADAHNGLGRILAAQGRFNEAAESFRQAVACVPTPPQSYLNLGNILLLANDLDGACSNYDVALALDPGFWEALNNRAHARLQRGERAGAYDDFAAALRLRPDSAVVASNKLNGEIEKYAASPGAVLPEYREWNRRFAEPLAPAQPARAISPDPGRRLRIGYVSPDFRGHAMGYFIEPLLEHCDPAAFEITCYSNCRLADSMTARFQALAHRWRDIVHAGDSEVAEQIAADGIDLLVDLSGHSADHRLLVFARRPAPLQFTFLGYPATTGVSAIGYRITDAYADPPGVADAFYTERLLRLPDCWCCFRPPADAPEIGPLPAAVNGHVTFGSFNGIMKINEGTIGTWANLLARVPGSRLVMITVAPGETERRVRAAFAASGIGENRLELLPRIARPDYLALRNRVDIALDPFPVNGGTTTCDSLWMGVPTVSLAGSVLAARAGMSLLSNVGLADLCAGSAEEYVAIAAALAHDLPRLQSLRGTLRQTMRASPLLDGARFVHNLETLYRNAWRDWCAQREPAS
jgi:protein O-GlcNAc transferase